MCLCESFGMLDICNKPSVINKYNLCLASALLSVMCPVTTNHLQMTFTGMRQKSDHFSVSVLCWPLIGPCPTDRGPHWLNLTLTLHWTNGALMTVGALAVKLGQKEHSTSFNCLDILYCSTSPLISH